MQPANPTGKCANLVTGALLMNCDLRKMDLSFKDLSGANLNGANLQGADLRNANLQGAILIFADLSGANLEGANLKRASLVNANLQDANLLDADISGADLYNTNLSGADRYRAPSAVQNSEAKIVNCKYEKCRGEGENKRILNKLPQEFTPNKLPIPKKYPELQDKISKIQKVPPELTKNYLPNPGHQAYEKKIKEINERKYMKYEEKYSKKTPSYKYYPKEPKVITPAKNPIIKPIRP